MEPIKISVTGALATVTQKPVLTSGTVGLNVDFTFDGAWTGLKKTAVFRCGNRPIPPVLCEENRAQVPWEALEKPGCTLFVGVYGTDSEGIDLPTVWAEVDRVREGATVPDVDPSEPTPNAYEQLLAAAKQAAAAAESVRQDADNGKFKGDQGEQGPKGDKGDAGVIDFIVVTELPADGDGSKIYLLPNATGENNNFDEYIFQNGEWEKIGSAGVEVNLDEYVKKTDYATYNNPGLATVSSTYNGLSIGNNGALSVYPAAKAHIDGRNSSCPIAPGNLDYAVKVGLTTNKETWTEEEKQAAREQIGIDIVGYKKAGIVNVDAAYGIYATADGTLYAVSPNEQQIDSRAGYGGISANRLDYAIKSGLTKNNLEWTDEEKVAVANLLGSNSQNKGSMLVQRYSNGNIAVPPVPTADVHATSKQYVDEQIAALAARIEALEGK